MEPSSLQHPHSSPAPTKEWRIPGYYFLEKTFQRFSATEKVAFTICGAIAAVSGLLLLYSLSHSFEVQVPARGGSITEGVVGIPRFINPLLALSDTDRDLTTLTYAGLVALEGDTIVPDIASDYTVSADGLQYTFTLRDDARFHDGTPVTADDVEFTIQKAQDPALKSPRRAAWEGVTIEKIDPHHIRFILKRPYAPFLENATLGILPKHIWKNSTPEAFTFSHYNTKPIGAGPYMIDTINLDKAGLPHSYELIPFEHYTRGAAFISRVTMMFYPNEDMLVTAWKNDHSMSMHGIAAETAHDIQKDNSHAVVTAPLARVFGIFFNQNQPALAFPEVRKALELATNKQALVQEVLFGFGTPTDDPIPAELLGVQGSIKAIATAIPATSTPATSTVKTSTKTTAKTKTPAPTINAAALLAAITPPPALTPASILEQAGWTKNTDGIYEKRGKKDAIPLEFVIATANSPELKQAADIVKKQWEAIGARVSVKIFEPGDLTQTIIRPRKFDALLFGEVISRDLDMFAFWHSSQRTDPGLNIAQYTNLRVDRALEDARTATTTSTQKAKIIEALGMIKADVPAIFLYTPSFIYITPDTIHGRTLGTITTAADRFSDIAHWYMNTEYRWKAFMKPNEHIIEN